MHPSGNHKLILQWTTPLPFDPEQEKGQLPHRLHQNFYMNLLVDLIRTCCLVCLVQGKQVGHLVTTNLK